MQVDFKELRRHYAALSDGEILELDRAELVERAQKIYDEELARRGLDRPPEEDSPAEAVDVQTTPEGADFDIDGPPPDWLEDAACPYSKYVSRSNDYASGAAEVRAALWAAGIPSYVVLKPEEPQDPEPRDVCSVMVPGGMGTRATGVVERDIHNPRIEADWRTHLETLSDEELAALKPEVFCAALLDLAERLKRVYREEIAKRKR